MKIVCADAETYFADDFTLSKMSTEAYIRDPRFEVHGWAIKWGEDYAARWYTHDQAKYIFAQEDWNDIALLAHHAQFDGLILSHVYGVKPKLWLDTLSYARLLIGNHLSVGLDSLARHFNLQAKIVPYQAFKNRHWSELSREVQEQVAAGACHDVELTWQLFKILGKDVPREEYAVVDELVRMFTEPSLAADLDMLAAVWEKEEKEKAGRLAELNVEAADLASAERFAGLLRAEGIEPETKQGKNGAIYAFARTDAFMQDLREHANPRVALLVQARLGEKSTLLQTRAESLGWMGSRGAMPVYLRYCGTGTLRPSGGDGCLTADTRVLVYDWHNGLTEKRIVDILADDLIWDGVEFVAHEGVKFQGYREVIEYDGLKATPDHHVFVQGKPSSLARAAKTRTRIMDCPAPTDRDVDAAARNFHNACIVPLSMRKRTKRSIQRIKK